MSVGVPGIGGDIVMPPGGRMGCGGGGDPRCRRIESVRLLAHRRLRQERSFDLFLLKLEVNGLRGPVAVNPV